jgi:hypothetical protein
LSGNAPPPPDELVEPEQCALAARRSWMSGNAAIRLNELAADDRYDGAAFAKSYRALRYPKA